MKKILTTVLILSVVFSFTACDKGFEKENTDPIGIISSPPEKLLAPALVNLLKTNLVRNRTFSNELMQVTVTMSDDENAVFRYDFRPSYADYTWNGWYSELTNIKDIYDIASTPEHQNDSYKGISRILESWVFSLLTDSYGDVPFTEANQGKTGLVEPVFDSQKDIYKALFSKLEEANTLLSGSTAAVVPSSDPVYHGDISLWRKFGNSLYLRLLLRVSAKAEVSSEVIAKIKEIIQDNPSKYPVFTSNNESAVLKWTGGTNVQDPFTNPYVMQYKEADFPLVALAYFFMQKLNEWHDPRIDLTNQYGHNSRNRLGIAPGGNGLVGIESGYVPGTVDMRQSYFYSSSNSEFSLQTSPLTGILMTCAEVEFIKAEAIAKGWVSGSASEHYYKGIANAINYWVPNFSTNITGAEFTSYISNAGLEWNDALPLDATTGDSKMERILLPKYFCLFITDFQQWFEYRRTGHPILPKGAGLQNGGKMPARLNYPTYLQSANPTNYSKAAANMGGDNINSLVWWQKP
ncbi:SusD/RagB family nutrient-binding outer membrane lipoprotein [Pedobacter sp. BS3]|uniref:SusD/RagB family nutrient-binding outer membrane lipoprotein n=1 Tax=Pedobacter sp. BS3 TaxID=2567937 RepID=UPI0011EC2F06|nr:SusD/RagB family nutrient-binding outer membrane lipoprotein [Pedobacter sp. BS3]TZF83164.1 SusD/RagB family nutrient-binding outer membrane lipoprotein [Pedobacter sp. BS3]